MRQKMTILTSLFLFTILGIFASLTLFAVLGQSESRTTAMRKSVIVIGGGAAGLRAASVLAKNENFDVTLLEAADRIGGRIYTTVEKSPDGTMELLERGAQWIHGENSVFDLVKRYDDKLIENEPYCSDDEEDEIDELVTNLGTNISKELLNKTKKWYKILQDGPSERDLPDKSFGNWFLKKIDADKVIKNSKNDLEKEKVSAILNWLERTQMSYDGCDNWFDLSIRGQLVYQMSPGCFLIRWLTGYHTLLNIILNENTTDTRIPDWIKLNDPVTKIDHSTMPIVTTTKSGAVYKSDAVIVTVSLGVLKATQKQLFHPHLPLKKQQAIDNLAFGTVNKIYVHFENPWWDEDQFGLEMVWINDNKTDKFPTWTKGLHNFETSDLYPKVLLGWITGEYARAIELIDNTELTQIILKVIETFSGKSMEGHKDSVRVEVTKWHSNSFIRGSYSYDSITAVRMNVTHKDVATPIFVQDSGILCFAGEATHPTHFSTVHGAVESGKREAKRLIQFYAPSNNN